MSQRVVVLGGGYAGVMAANRLAGSTGGSGLDVLLVDPGEAFTERIRLHRVAAGTRASAAVPWQRLLHERVRRLRARAVRIDPASHQVELDDEAIIRYDWLVYAVGSGEPVPSLLSVTNAAVADVTRKRIARLAPGTLVRIAGSGPTGVELAAAVASARPDLVVTITAPQERAHPFTGEIAIARRLRSLSVVFVSGSVDPATGASTDSAGRKLPPAGATVWTAGLRFPTLAAQSGLPVADDGRLIVDATLAVPGHERIVGAGDAITVAGSAGAHVRASCAAALPLGAHAADTVLAGASARRPDQIDIGYAVQCLDLGGTAGHVRFVHPDDTPTAWGLGGLAGGWVKEQICRKTIAWLVKEAKRPGSYSWPNGPASSSRWSTAPQSART